MRHGRKGMWGLVIRCHCHAIRNTSNSSEPKTNGFPKVVSAVVLLLAVGIRSQMLL